MLLLSILVVYFIKTDRVNKCVLEQSSFIAVSVSASASTFGTSDSISSSSVMTGSGGGVVVVETGSPGGATTRQPQTYSTVLAPAPRKTLIASAPLQVRDVCRRTH